MRFGKRALIPLCTACLLATLALTPAAQAQEQRRGQWQAQEHRGPAQAQEHRALGRVQDRRDHDRQVDRREFERREFERRDAERREFERRREFDRRAAWRFERGRGWRFEHGPGFWSPFYAWWWIGGRPVMLEVPTVTVVPYSTGRYELRGDGVTVPYYWVWIPTYTYAAAPPPPAVPPAAPADYPLGSIPAPPPPPAS